MPSALNQMDQVTQTNAASSEESASAAQDLQAHTHAIRHALTRLQSLIDSSQIVSTAGASDQPQQPARKNSPSADPAAFQDSDVGTS